MIDTGWDSDESFNSLRKQLVEIGVNFPDISRIIVTHAHFDHYGLAGRVKKLSGAKIHMHRLDKEIFHTRYIVTDEYRNQNEEWFRINGVPTTGVPMMRMAFGGPANNMPAHPDVFINDGETITCGVFNLKVIWTPGHSPGHVCLYESNTKLFFSGDHVLPVITPNISLTPQSKNNPLGDFLQSMKDIRQLDVSLVLPAHENIFNNLSKRVDEILHHHEMRTAEILQTLNHNEMNAYQISWHITWMPEMGGVKFENLMPGDRRAAVSETLAHLKAMTVDGIVKTINKDHIVYYLHI
jgi:glyoxylase-like metal-dependent hydrolase (beta-lactamase superfamily II)